MTVKLPWRAVLAVTLSIAVLTLLSCVSRGGKPQQGTISSVEQTATGLRFSLGADKTEIQILASDVLRLNFMPGGESGPRTQVLTEDAIFAPVPSDSVAIDSSSDPMTITTHDMKVKIPKSTGSLSVYDGAGTLLFEGSDPGGANYRGFGFTHPKGQNFYGVSGYEAREPSRAGMLRDGLALVDAGMQGNGSAPFLWTTAGYGVLVDSDGGRFNIDETVSFTGISKKNVEYFVMLGKPAGIMKSVSALSGKTPMFPKWALGFMNSQWSIDQGELENIVKTYRAKQIPVDSMILDFDWKAWGSDDYGEWNWNGAKFPDGASGRLKTGMDAQGIKLLGIMKPRIHVQTAQGAYATEHKFWYPGRRVYSDYFSRKAVNDINFALPESRSWFWEHFKKAFDTGIVGWWNDEADGFDNFQFMNMQRSLYDGQRAYSDLRVVSLNRNFYLGAQRYAYGLWSGDIDTGFLSMAAQRERMLSAIGVGATKWGMDSGGFNGTPGAENYARWIEFGAFVPIFRVHGTNGEKRQPWVYGKTAEAAAKKAIQLRYTLLPYMYSYERQAFEDGTGLVRPLYFDWPQDPAVMNDKESWMFGDHLLVSPVVVQGQTVKRIYLPEGTWTDYFSGAVYRGGRTIDYAVDKDNFDDIPLFIKAGAIIATRDPENYVGEKPESTVYLDVFADVAESRFSYYDDDGKTYAYEKDGYFKQTVTAQKTGNRIQIRLLKPEGGYTPELRTYVLRVHGLSAQTVKLNGVAASTFTVGTDRYGPLSSVTAAAGVQTEFSFE